MGNASSGVYVECYECGAETEADAASIRASGWVDAGVDLQVDLAETQDALDAERAKVAKLEEEIERLKTAKSYVAMQAGTQHLEANAQRSTVLEILQALGLPLRDWDATGAVKEHVARLRAALAQAREALQLALSGGDVELHTVREDGEVKLVGMDWRPATRKVLEDAVKALELKP